MELPGGSGSRAVKTGSGDVLLDCGGEAIQVETSSGDVHIRNLADASFSLETETGSGDLEGAVFRELGADEDAKRFQGVYGSSPEFQIILRTEAGICGWSDRCPAGNLCAAIYKNDPTRKTEATIE